MSIFGHVFAFFGEFWVFVDGWSLKKAAGAEALLMPGNAAIFAACSSRLILMPMLLYAICSETPLITLSSLIYSHMTWPEAI